MDRPDPPLLALLFANGITIVLALLQDWSLGTVLVVYWFQSVTIGLFTVVRLLGADGRGRFQGLALAGFFTLHYGLFHLVYLVFILTFAFTGMYGLADPLGIALGCAVFFANHLISYLWYRPRETEAPMQIFAEPYARILPMHLTIIAGGFVSAILPGEAGSRLVLLLFLLLKAGADVVAHQRKHARAGPAPAPGPAEVAV